MFNLRSLDLNLLTVFEAIYDIGTVSGAADRLALSQSATSHALSRLREACRDALFVRASRGLSPTPMAKEMYPAIKQALEALRASLAEVGGFDPALSERRFRLSIPHPMAPFYLLALRAAVATAAPSVVLTFDTVSRPRGLEESLRDGAVDVAIDWLPVELDPFINGKLFDDRLALLVRRGHPLADVDVSIEDLLKAEFVALHHRRAIEHAPAAIREFLKLGMREAVHVSELLEIPAVVSSTDLVGVFGASMGSLMEGLGLQVLPIPISIELPPLPIYMIWHETRRHDTAHSWLREIVVAELGRFGNARKPDRPARARRPYAGAR
jgi:LysR family transcriptional regulator, transcriptional activator for leuABCD operon